MKLSLLSASSNYTEYQIKTDDKDLKTVMHVEETGSMRILFFDYGEKMPLSLRSTAIRQLIRFKRNNQSSIEKLREEQPSLCSRHTDIRLSDKAKAAVARLSLFFA